MENKSTKPPKIKTKQNGRVKNHAFLSASTGCVSHQLGLGVKSENLVTKNMLVMA
jgi:hypothetical protein